MTKASDNAFPSILITEGTEPTAPAAGKQRVYIDSTSHKLKRTDSSGTDVTIEGAASGDVTASGLTMATAKMLGRSTAATGAIEEITVGTNLTLSAGTLSASSGSGEFAENSSIVMSAGDCSTTSTTFAQLSPNPTVTITTAAVRCLIIFTSHANNSTAGQTFYIDLDIDGTRVSGAANGLTSITGNTAANVGFTFLTDVLTAASHTFKIVGRVTANTGALRSDGTNYRAKLTVIETGQTT